LIYSTYLGGSNRDGGAGIAVDVSGCAYVAGSTYSTDFPTVNPYQASFQGGFVDAFITQLSRDGDELVYSTYLGGSDSDYGTAIASDVSGCAYVTGTTYSTDFPTESPFMTQQGEQDIFISKLSSETSYICGDANNDGDVNVSDAVWVVNYVFVGGDPPDPFEAGDANCDGEVNVSDAVWIVNWVFVGGNDPCDSDGDTIPDC